MAPLIKIILTIVGVGVGAALLSPPIYCLIQVGTEICPWLASIPFHRVFSRLLLICFLLAMGPLLIALRISNFKELGLQKNSRWACDFSWGLLMGLLPMTFLMMAYVYFDVCGVRDHQIELTSVLRVAGTAVGVSILEELLFRGLLYGLSRRTFGAFFSALWTSAFFAIVHFIRSAGPSAHPLDAWSGFRECGRIFSAAPPPLTLAFGLASLFFISLLLCWTVERTHSLALPIGLHVGWIFAIQTINLLIGFRLKAPGVLPWVGPNVVSGMVPIGIFAILAICTTFLLCGQYLHGRARKISATKCA